MDALVIILVVLVVLAAIAAAVAVVWRRRRSAHLRERFGPEYDRTVEESADSAAAEKDLRQREKRRAEFTVVPLSSEAAARYRDEWNDIQLRFVDEPSDAVQEADRLVVQIMRDRGYPMDDFDQRAGDVSVDHPQVAHHYRDAHGVAVAQTNGRADTEQLRQAVTSYRALVDALLDHDDAEQRGAQDHSNLQEER